MGYTIKSFFVVNPNPIWINNSPCSSCLWGADLCSHKILFCILFVLKEKSPDILWIWLYFPFKFMLLFYLCWEGMWLVSHFFAIFCVAFVFGCRYFTPSVNQSGIFFSGSLTISEIDFSLRVEDKWWKQKFILSILVDFYSCMHWSVLIISPVVKYLCTFVVYHLYKCFFIFSINFTFLWFLMALYIAPKWFPSFSHNGSFYFYYPFFYFSKEIFWFILKHFAVFKEFSLFFIPSNMLGL